METQDRATSVPWEGDEIVTSAVAAPRGRQATQLGTLSTDVNSDGTSEDGKIAKNPEDFKALTKNAGRNVEMIIKEGPLCLAPELKVHHNCPRSPSLAETVYRFGAKQSYLTRTSP